MKASIDCSKIMKLRLSMDLNVTELGNKLGVSRAMVSRMESDPKYNPGVLTLYIFSSFYNVQIDDLLIKE
jgi:transcriptional regulator with XRE-family HTH domain